MSIRYDEKRCLFQIDTPRMSYAFAVTAGVPLSLYWGAPIDDPAAFDSELERIGSCLHMYYTGGAVPTLRYECATNDFGDFGEASVFPCFADGVRGMRPVYQGYAIEDGTLRITLRDKYYDFTVTLCYQPVAELDLIERWIEVSNATGEDVRLKLLRCGNVQLPPHENYRVTHYSGNWGSEYRPNQCLLGQEQLVLESHRGTCSSHQHTPFIMLDPNAEASAERGEVFFAALQWSGEIKMILDKNTVGDVQLCAGWNDYDAEWTLKSGETLASPHLTIGYSAAGFDRVTEILYDWQYDVLCPQTKAHNELPIIYNSWYPYEFDIREENMLSLVEKAADIGAELFVIDDGWMPGRVNEHKGLGDWRADPDRLPHGLLPISQACHSRGMKFGLWVEPEMCNPDSDLFRAHPDWIIRSNHRENTLQRGQLTLNMARDDVRDWAIEWLDRLIDDYSLDYLKWDMNRYLSERGWPEADLALQPSLTIRYMQNIYAIWAHLNEKHPHVLFENCASGGGRTDFGMARYADRINRSDNSRPRDVLLLHEGFSRLFLAKTAGGAGNISGENCAPLDYRILLGMTGSMSVGLNLLKVPDETLNRLREAIARFKTFRADLQNAYVYTLISAENHPYAVFEYLRRDRRSVSVFVFGLSVHNWTRIPPLRLHGLMPDALYFDDKGTPHTGRELMNIGLRVSLSGDYDCRFIRLTEK